MTSLNDNLILEEEGFVGGRANNRFKPAQCNWSFTHTIIALLALFPYITIPILFGLVANVRNVTNNYNDAVVSVAFPVSSGYDEAISYRQSQTSRRSIAGSVDLDPVIVSLNSRGQLQVGAGTTIYRNQSNYASSCPYYIDLDAVFESSYILSYYDQKEKESILSIAHIDGSRNVHVVSPYASNYTFYETAVLNQNAGIFVSIAQDANADEETAYLVAGQVNEASFKFTLGSPILYTQIYSVNPQITRLSDVSFAITYYDTSALNALTTRYGTIMSDLSIQLSEPTQVIADNANAVYNSIVGLTDSTFFIVYYNSNVTTNDNNLKTVLVTVTPNTVVDNVVMSVSAPTVLSNAHPAYYLSSSRISNDTAVVVFAESYANYALRAVVISNDNTLDGSLSYSSSLLVTSGQTFTTLEYEIVPDIDVNVIFSTYGKLDDGRRTGNASIAVLYSDLSNGGATETALLQLSSSGSLVRMSPDFVLNNGNENYETTNSWGALATANGAPFDSQTLIVSVLSDINCAASTSFEFSILESLPLAVGVVAASTSVVNIDATVDTVVAGTMSGFSNLVVGKPYYATTKGTIVAGPSYYGRYSDGELSMTFIDTADDENSKGIVTSLESFVGIAVSSSKILLK